MQIIEELKKADVETYVIISEAAKVVMEYETDNLEKSMERIRSSAYKIYDEKNIAASIASGSFSADGMIIAPCSMKTLSSVANGYADNLVSRAADVQIKQKRKLVLIPRETPLNSIHLGNMLKMSDIGAWIIPPMLCFYNAPKTIDDMISNTIGRVLDVFSIEHTLYRRWDND